MTGLGFTLLSLLLILPLLGAAQSVEVQAVWETDTTLRTPESELFDASHQLLYVSCVNGEATPQNHSRFIATVGVDGKVRQLLFVDKLNVTKGMGILNDKLNVTELTQLVEIELSTGKISKRYPVEGAQFLNDIAIDAQKHTVYFTDSKAGKIWVLANGKTTLLASGIPLSGTNGLLLTAVGDLLIGNGDGKLLRLNPTTGQVRLVATLARSGSIDGIVSLGDGTYLINEVAGKMWHLQRNGKLAVVLDTTTQRIESADTAYDLATQTLFVPTLKHNTVRAFHVQLTRP